MRGWQSGSSGVYLASVRPWCETPAPPKIKYKFTWVLVQVIWWSTGLRSRPSFCGFLLPTFVSRCLPGRAKGKKPEQVLTSLHPHWWALIWDSVYIHCLWSLMSCPLMCY
jgi:hypothetical protein